MSRLLEQTACHDAVSMTSAKTIASGQHTCHITVYRQAEGKDKADKETFSILRRSCAWETKGTFNWLLSSTRVLRGSLHSCTLVGRFTYGWSKSSARNTFAWFIQSAALRFKVGAEPRSNNLEHVASTIALGDTGCLARACFLRLQYREASALAP